VKQSADLQETRQSASDRAWEDAQEQAENTVPTYSERALENEDLVLGKRKVAVGIIAIPHKLSKTLFKMA